MTLSSEDLHEDLLKQAVALATVHIIECNHSIWSVDGVNKRFQKMFPDLGIAYCICNREKTQNCTLRGVFRSQWSLSAKKVNG